MVIQVVEAYSFPMFKQLTNYILQLDIFLLLLEEQTEA